MNDGATSPPAVARKRELAGLEALCPTAVLAVGGAALPLLGDSYLGVIATRACIYWVLVSGLNLVVGFAGQIAIGWVALLTLGAYVTSVLTAGTAVPELSPYLALADRRSVRGDLRRHRRPAGAAVADVLFRHDDAWALRPSSRRWRWPGRA